MRENTLNQFLSFALGWVLFLSAMLVAPGNAGAQTAPTFVGVRTFLSAPYEPDLDKLKADFAVLGVPFDEGTWGQPGERYGPRDMRENSQEYAHDLTQGFYYIDSDRTVLKGKHWVDVGDVIIYPTVAVETNAKITETVKKILAKKAFPIILGGDHSITFPVVRAYDDLRDMPDYFLAGEEPEAVRCGALRCGICGHVADGGHEHSDSKSGAR